ncbi:hypothetical protein AB1K89_06775 [Sporosarcina sp. 179-K 8C2 HS]|uniref:hypothetical protein n=1 Tax=Sporosarcina sp. 179-K 8C2 HS TaxID=3142387 RepID=UPI0039A277FA
MANDNFEKRMEFLKKSYEHVPSSFDQDEVFRMIDQEKAPQPKEQKPSKGGIRQTFTIWAMGFASIFILGLIGTGYIFDQKQKTEENIVDSAELDDYIEELKAKYEVEKEKRREMLKMDEEHFEQYVGSTTMALLSIESYVKNVKQYENAKEILLNQYTQAIEELKLPSEMIEDLKRNPLTDNEAGSIDFIATYREKVKNLLFVYGTINSQNYDAIKEFEVSPSVDKVEIIMLTSKSFPEQLQNMINTMREQSFRLETDKYLGEIGPRYYESHLHQELNSNLHTHTFGYREMLIYEPYMFGGILDHPPLQSSSMMRDMEYTLMNVEQDSTLYPILKRYYSRLFNQLLKGSDQTKIFDADGVLLPEYQEAWRNMAGGGQATPMRYILDPIIKEMEASGWRKSASWDALDNYELEKALVLYRGGVLEEYMYGERPDFRDVTIQLPDASFKSEVQDLYEDFKKTYDKSLLKGVSPVHVLAMFDLANELDDPETMYYLTNENHLKYDETGLEYTLEMYVENWRKGLSYFHKPGEVRFDGQAVYRDQHTFYSSVTFPGSVGEVPMTFNEEGIWEVGTKNIKVLPSHHLSPELDFQEELMSMSAFYYEGIVSVDDTAGYLRWVQPLDILAMYFYAGDKGFYEMQYELFYQGGGSEVVDKETYLQNPEKYFLPYDDKMYKKVSFQGLEQDKNGNWPGIATLTVDTELYPDLPSERKFHMYWTEDGWRVKFNPFEK